MTTTASASSESANSESANSESANSESANSESANSESAGDERAPQVWGTLQAHDAAALIDFYVDVFGFVRTAVYADGDRVAHAQLDWPEGGGIMMGSYYPGNEWTREPGTAGLYVVTDNVDEVYQRVRAAGATVIREPKATDYGSYELACVDPEGNHWSFGTYRGEPRPS